MAIRAFGGSAPQVHKTAFVAPGSELIGRVKLAKDSSVWFGAVLRGDINEVSVGSGSNIQDNCVLHVERNRGCVVKSNVTVGHSAVVHACTVGNGCLIGIGATILNGAEIGSYSIIGAHALVLENTKIPPRSLVVGTPAKVIRKLSDKEVEGLKQSARNYIRLAKEYSSDADFWIDGSGNIADITGIVNQ